MPASNARALEKAKTLAADGLILDLEDAVSPDAKPEARANIAAVLKDGNPYGQREVIVRINSLNTPWGHADIAAAATLEIDGIAIPKVESADTIRQVQAAIRECGGPDNMQIWAMIETPMGVLRAEDIAGASPNVAGLIMGTSDLAKDLQCEHIDSRLPFITAFGLCILAARAHGVAILDGVHLNLSDDEGFVTVCEQGRALGFDGKTLIHPKTIAVTNTTFAPNPEDVAHAKSLISVYAQAVAEGKGVVVLDGKLIEQLHVDNANRLVALSEAISKIEAEPT